MRNLFLLILLSFPAIAEFADPYFDSSTKLAAHCEDRCRQIMVTDFSQAQPTTLYKSL